MKRATRDWCVETEETTWAGDGVLLALILDGTLPVLVEIRLEVGYQLLDRKFGWPDLWEGKPYAFMLAPLRGADANTLRCQWNLFAFLLGISLRYSVK